MDGIVNLNSLTLSPVCLYRIMQRNPAKDTFCRLKNRRSSDSISHNAPNVNHEGAGTPGAFKIKFDTEDELVHEAKDILLFIKSCAQDEY